MVTVSVHLNKGEIPRIKFDGVEKEGVYWMDIGTADSNITIYYPIEKQDKLKNALLNAIKDL